MLRVISRIRVVVVLAALLNVFAFPSYAHNPHDPTIALAISPDYPTDRTLFVSTFPELNWGYFDVMRSTDAGATWTKLPNGLDNRFPLTAIRLSPTYPTDGTVYAATHGDGVYMSTTRGDTWTLINDGLAGLNIQEMILAGGPGSDYVLFASTVGGGLYRRESGDSSWTLVIDAPIFVPFLATSRQFSTDQTVVALDGSNRLRSSIDGGLTWTTNENALSGTVYDIKLAPDNPNEMFLGTSDGVFYSNDGGVTFVSKSATLPVEGVNNLVVSPAFTTDLTVFCTTITRSVYKSTDGGETWTLYASGAAITKQPAPEGEFMDLQISDNYAADGEVFLGTFDGLYRSVDTGLTWTQIETRRNLVEGLALSTNFATDGGAIATVYGAVGMHASLDRGNTWTQSVSGWTAPRLKPHTFFDVQFIPNHVGPPMAVATRNYSMIGFSSDLGASWNAWQIPDMPAVTDGWVYPTVIGVSPRFDKDRTLFLGTRRHGVIRSLDGGKTWRAMPSVPKEVVVTGIAVSPNYAVDRTVFVGNLKGEVWRTTNRGTSWVRVGAAPIVLRPGNETNLFTWVAISPAYASDRLVLVGTNNGVYRSKNGGNTWQRYGNGNIGVNRTIQQVEFSPNFRVDRTVFVTVRGKGIIRMTLNANGWISSLRNVGTTLLNQNVAFTEFAVSPTFQIDGTILGASNGGVYRSTDRGDTWVFAGGPVYP